MLRRDFTRLLPFAGTALTTGFAASAQAQFTETDAAAGIRSALERGAEFAIASLGRTDGFLGNPKVRIPLPSFLDKAAKMLKFTGGSGRVDELVTAMNRAAEAAVPEARALLLGAVRSMSVDDGRRILSGGDDSVTQFFASKTREPLTERFLPIVSKETERLSLAEKYNAVAGKAAGFGLVNQRDANIQQYVTAKALDGLYLMIGEEEKKIRSDPIGTGSAILQKVFGGLR